MIGMSFSGTASTSLMSPVWGCRSRTLPGAGGVAGAAACVSSLSMAAATSAISCFRSGMSVISNLGDHKGAHEAVLEVFIERVGHARRVHDVEAGIEVHVPDAHWTPGGRLIADGPPQLLVPHRLGLSNRVPHAEVHAEPMLPNRLTVKVAALRALPHEHQRGRGHLEDSLREAVLDAQAVMECADPAGGRAVLIKDGHRGSQIRNGLERRHDAVHHRSGIEH